MTSTLNHKLYDFLEEKYNKYHNIEFIKNDPISAAHDYKKLQDIEICSFFACMFAWGKRNIIINKTRSLMNLMDNSPYEFILNHNKKDLENFNQFKHRTFNFIDLKYFLSFLQNFYKKNHSLEDCFMYNKDYKDNFNLENSLNHFYDILFSQNNCPQRTKKHVSAPKKKSLCKRINMFLRWMVRKGPIDFGLWKKIPISHLIIPCDVHVLRISKKLGIIKNEKNNWETAKNLTEILKEYDKNDPVKYDFALFGTGIEEKELVY